MFSPTVRHSCWNTAVEPVKWMPARSRSGTATSPTIRPLPVTMLITPGGSPAASSSRIRKYAASSWVCAGFHTTVLPSNAGAVGKLPAIAVKLNGVIAGNLPTAPALLGNTVVWKPAQTQLLAAYFLMRLLEAAGLPPGVINMVTGSGRIVGEVAAPDRDLAGIHFTGSTAVFQQLWRTVGENIDRYRGYPRLVGETGGKDFVIAHPSADIAAHQRRPQRGDVGRRVRGAFDYQGQKCSAASRAYIPRSLW